MSQDRIVVLDTETTGISHEAGHRIIEIGCVEIINRRITGEHYHVYINPERLVDEGAFKVHGISNEFLVDKPVFAQISDDFLKFIGDSELVIHNAPFDVGFLNSELLRLKKGTQPIEKQCQITDTLVMARKRHRGQKNNLDALCKRYDINNSARTLHGALLDAEILADVYLAMTGGQESLFSNGLEEDASFNINAPASAEEAEVLVSNKAQDDGVIILKASDAALSAHQALLQQIADKQGHCLWLEIEKTEE